MDEASQNRATFSSSNQDYLSADAVHTRLDSDKLLERVETTLRGKVLRAVRDHKTKQVNYEYQSIGEPLMNDLGIQQTIGFLNMVFGPQVVLGNLEDYEIERIVYEVHTGLAGIFIHNLNDWGINEDHYEIILLSIVTTIQAYLSRTLKGFESTNLQTKISSVESNTLKEGNRGLIGGLFKNGG